MTEQQAQDWLLELERRRQHRRQAIQDRGLPTHDMELDMMLTPWLIERVKTSQRYAQNLYAAMCNRSWQEHAVWPILQDETWSCSWRYAGDIVARLRGEGDYIDWYCSGIRDAEDHAREGTVTEGVITPEIEKDLAALGWRPVDEPHDHV
jgi:hypothetical protein